MHKQLSQTIGPEYTNTSPYRILQTAAVTSEFVFVGSSSLIAAAGSSADNSVFQSLVSENPTAHC